uniref:Uncharacterized protein n=1 Tax=Anguilla anguilla TaxID=7936 RepID=A0A0E9R3N5_ANGAN
MLNKTHIYRLKRYFSTIFKRPESYSLCTKAV